MRAVSVIKQWIVPAGRARHKVQFGLLSGLEMMIDLSCQTQVYLGLSEREVFGWMKKLSKGIKTALDIGAGDGQYTLFFMAKTEAKKVWAFEPLAYNQQRIRENLSFNGLDNSPRLQQVSKYVNSYIADNEVTLDSLADQMECPVLVKMDVDTLEYIILQGAKKFLDLPDVRWMIETHSPQLETDCMAFLESHGYKTKLIKNAWWRVFVPELRPIGQNRWFVAYKPQSQI